MPKVILITLTVLTYSNWPISKPNGFESDENDTTVVNPVDDYKDLIGTCNCKSLRRNKAGQWADTTDLKWEWEYIMNGQSIQDTGEYYEGEELKYFTSIRVYDSIHQQWYVSYFTPNPTTVPKTWTGGKVEGDIVLKREDDTDQGKLLSTLTFSKISAEGFQWEGKATNLASGNEYVFWKIWCKKFSR